MAYNAGQENIIAFELARADYNVAAAVAALREGYESFSGIGETTLRARLKEPEFQDLVAKKMSEVRDARDRATRALAERKALQEIEGSLTDKLRADEDIVDSLRKKIEAALDKAEDADGGLELKTVVSLYAQISKSTAERRAKALPAISSQREFSELLIIIAEESQNFLKERAPKFMQRIRERYVALADKPTAEAAAADGN